MNRRRLTAALVVGVGVAIVGAWLLADPELALPALWATRILGLPLLVGGVVWMLAEYLRDRRRLLRSRLRQLRRID
ncbi:MAG TPA: hypothetical protein VMI34_11360 [Candidatus Bathyarchaeia archaeon]|nr:hypothetical protein [Candidatus Bathyarchaeia archaeon]